MNNFDLIKKARKLLGIKQTEIAKEINVNQSNYCNMENGKIKFTNTSFLMKRIVDFLLPKLEDKILQQQNDLSELKDLKQKLIKFRSK